MYLEGKFPEWGVTFGEISLDDLSINKLISCPILNQIASATFYCYHNTDLLNILMILCCKWSWCSGFHFQDKDLHQLSQSDNFICTNQWGKERQKQWHPQQYSWNLEENLFCSRYNFSLDFWARNWLKLQII